MVNTFLYIYISLQPTKRYVLIYGNLSTTKRPAYTHICIDNKMDLRTERKRDKKWFMYETLN